MDHVWRKVKINQHNWSIKSVDYQVSLKEIYIMFYMRYIECPYVIKHLGNSTILFRMKLMRHMPTLPELHHFNKRVRSQR